MGNFDTSVQSYDAGTLAPPDFGPSRVRMKARGGRLGTEWDRPVLRLAVFVHNEGLGVGGKHLQGLQELDQVVLSGGGQVVEGAVRGEGFAIVMLDGLAHGGEIAVVHGRQRSFGIPGRRCG